MNDTKMKHGTWQDWMCDTVAGHNWFWNHNGIDYIMAGHGYKSTSSKAALMADLHRMKKDTTEIEKASEEFLQYKKDVVEYVKSLPTHYEFLRDEIYKTK